MLGLGTHRHTEGFRLWVINHPDNTYTHTIPTAQITVDIMRDPVLALGIGVGFVGVGVGFVCVA